MQSLVVPAPRVVPSPLLDVTLRDRRILRLALRKLNGEDDFAEAVRALHEAVTELIPSGRVYVIGHDARGPIVGSLITGVGICAGDRGVDLVRVCDERRTTLGSFVSP